VLLLVWAWLHVLQVLLLVWAWLQVLLLLLAYC
jgi:hypothetical protein